MAFNYEARHKGAKNAIDYMHRRPIPQINEPIGNFGVNDVSALVESIIFGLFDQGEHILPRCMEYIDQGLKGEEYNWFGNRYRHRSLLLCAKGIGSWLSNGNINGNYFSDASRFSELAWKDIAIANRIIERNELDLYMALSILGSGAADSISNAERLAIAIDTYETYKGRPRSFSLNGVLSPRELGYFSCQHYLNGKFDRSEIFEAGKKMLNSKMIDKNENGWLDRGLYFSISLWLMVVYSYPSHYSQDIIFSPVDVLLKIWDHVPYIERPTL